MEAFLERHFLEEDVGDEAPQAGILKLQLAYLSDLFASRQEFCAMRFIHGMRRAAM